MGIAHGKGRDVGTLRAVRNGHRGRETPAAPRRCKKLGRKTGRMEKPSKQEVSQEGESGGEAERLNKKEEARREVDH